MGEYGARDEAHDKAIPIIVAILIIASGWFAYDHYKWGAYAGEWINVSPKLDSKSIDRFYLVKDGTITLDEMSFGGRWRWKRTGDKIIILGDSGEELLFTIINERLTIRDESSGKTSVYFKSDK